jgi:S1-C subfamily serine protease
MEQLIGSHRVSYAYVGIETEDLTPAVARKLNYPVAYGAVVTKVRSGTPGSAAGFRGGSDKQQVLGTQFVRGGDVILGIDGQPVRSAQDVVRIVTQRVTPGQTAAFAILRGGTRRTLHVRLTERPTAPG